MTDTGIGAALRLGWAMAEARGRSWPLGPQPAKSTTLPGQPEDLLPLRSQRDESASRSEAVSTLVTQLRLLDFTGTSDVSTQLMADHDAIDEKSWPELAKTFKTMDGSIQDELARKDDALANAYLLGRGLAECYWGLGPQDPGDPQDAPPGDSLRFLFGPERRRELTRMLGRLQAPGVHELSPSVISGSLEAWGEVANQPEWTKDRPQELRDRLYEQVRRWYQLLVLTQDPTTMIKPSAQLGNRYYLMKTLRAFWLQGVLAVVALLLTSTFFLSFTADFFEQVKPLLATGGLTAFAAAGLLTKGQSAAQRMLVRLRQDAYTDLVCVSITAVPKFPEAGSAEPRRPEVSETLWQKAQEKAADLAWRNANTRVERAVRNRRLTPPTPPAPS